METYIYIITGIAYIQMMFILYKPFKRFTENEWMEHLYMQLLLWPIVFIVYTIVAIYEGFKHMYNNKDF